MENKLNVIFKGEDGYWSGKRIFGTICLITALILTIRAALVGIDLSGQAVLISPVFGAGLALWGISSYENIKFNDSYNHYHSQNVTESED